jgi:hypothetical protein
MTISLMTKPVQFHTGDVVELETDGGTVSALVLLATDEFLILDPCDDTTPVVVRAEELGTVRVFDGSLA